MVDVRGDVLLPLNSIKLTLNLVTKLLLIKQILILTLYLVKKLQVEYLKKRRPMTLHTLHN